MVSDEASTGWGLDQKRPVLALVLMFTVMIQTLPKRHFCVEKRTLQVASLQLHDLGELVGLSSILICEQRSTSWG